MRKVSRSLAKRFARHAHLRVTNLEILQEWSLDGRKLEKPYIAHVRHVMLASLGPRLATFELTPSQARRGRLSLLRVCRGRQRITCCPTWARRARCLTPT